MTTVSVHCDAIYIFSWFLLNYAHFLKLQKLTGLRKNDGLIDNGVAEVISMVIKSWQ